MSSHTVSTPPSCTLLPESGKTSANDLDESLSGKYLTLSELLDPSTLEEGGTDYAFIVYHAPTPDIATIFREQGVHSPASWGTRNGSKHLPPDIKKSQNTHNVWFSEDPNLISCAPLLDGEMDSSRAIVMAVRPESVTAFNKYWRLMDSFNDHAPPSKEFLEEPIGSQKTRRLNAYAGSARSWEELKNLTAPPDAEGSWTQIVTDPCDSNRKVQVPYNPEIPISTGFIPPTKIVSEELLGRLWDARHSQRDAARSSMINTKVEPCPSDTSVTAGKPGGNEYHEDEEGWCIIDP